MGWGAWTTKSKPSLQSSTESRVSNDPALSVSRLGGMGFWRRPLSLLGQRRYTTLSLATPSPASKLPSLTLVISLFWKDVSDSSSGISDVSRSSGNQMDVAVHHGLPCNLTAIHSDIESFNGRVRFDQFFLLPQDQSVNCIHFRLSEIKILEAMTFWDDQRMPRGDWKTVADDKSERIIM